MDQLASTLKVMREEPLASPERQDQIGALLERNRSCSGKMASSRVTAALFLLKRSMLDSVPVEQRTERFVGAQDAVAFALRCNPLDGGLWLVAATLDRLAVYEPERFLQFVAMSIRTAPYEESVLQRRWTLLAPLLGDKVVPIYNRVLADDLHAALRLGAVATAVATTAALRQSGAGGIADEALARLLPERRLALQTVSDGKQERQSRAARFRVFDLAPLGFGQSSSR
ncbi:hypothetical protein [Aureimonas sp. SA4125]|uniref:hypothetical protein n=1 Tax=Aureimonas sp. SA4125 TaxID=2826993 RepID=UPI001CC5A264|nr:hypothetical protein [Aureimonas sp. SA4125]